MKLYFLQSNRITNLIFSFPQNGISFAYLLFYVSCSTWETKKKKTWNTDFFLDLLKEVKSQFTD